MHRLLLVAAIAGCNPYEPDLGAAPFLCGPEEPRCPEGYFCVPQTDGREICSDTAADEFDCAIDPNEPNDSVDAPTTLDPPSVTLDGLAVCGDGDLDLYALTVVDGASIEVLVTFQPDGAVLVAQVLDPDGEPIAGAALLEGTTIRALADGLPAGTYFIQVEGPAAGAPTVNNYALTVNVQ